MSFKVHADTLYSPGELSEMLGYTIKTLATQRSRGNGIPFTKLGSRVFYLGKDIQQLVMSNRRRFSSERPNGTVV